MAAIKQTSVKTLIPYANNARTHSEEQITQIADSITEFGFTNPVLIDEEGNIIAGHGRCLAAKELGLDKIPTITITGLSPEQIKAYIIADNQLALNAGWDLDMVRIEIEQLEEASFDIKLLGFDNLFMTSLYEVVDFGAGTEGDQGELDKLEPKLAICPACGEEFDTRGS